jgi:DNA modification methylase
VNWEILEGDCREVLASLPERSVQTVVTSPPYFGLRDYGTGEWEGGGDGCDHKAPALGGGAAATSLGRRPGRDRLPETNAAWAESKREHRYGDECGKCGARRVDRQIGLEPSPDEYVAGLVAVFREVRRVLRDDGTVWLNLGDSYAGSWGAQSRPVGNFPSAKSTLTTNNGRGPKAGDKYSALSAGQIAAHPKGQTRTGAIPSGAPYKPKDLLGIPWMVAFALRADGWYLRSDIIWSKPNPMPESVTDRPTKAHEYLFLLSKGPRYFYDADAIRENGSDNSHGGQPIEGGPKQAALGQQINGRMGIVAGDAGRNRRSVWTVATQPYPGAHFACVDAATEVLTPNGWRAHDELVDGEWIAAYEDGRLLWEPATFHRYDYDGDLVAIEKRDLSQRLTPNHRCLVRSAKGHERVITADALTAGCRMPVSASFDLPEGTEDDACWGALLGWWIAEGHDRGGNTGRIYQSESANPSHVATIRRLLESVGFDFSEHRREREWRGRPSIEVEFRLRGERLDVLRRFAPGRKLTLETLEAAPDRASRQALLDALIDGDGHRRIDGRACIVQRDRDSIDAMQSLAIQLGYRAHITQRADGCHVLYLTRKQWITLRGTDGTHEKIGREHYEGVVWCPSVPSGFWLARRDGKPFITGNTFPPKLIEPCVLAGSSPKCCGVCGAPWRRVVERTPMVVEPSERRSGWQEDQPGLSRTQTGGTMTQAPSSRTVGWESSCQHQDDTGRSVVLDPFAGAGTTGVVSRMHDRRFIGIELNPAYAEMARERIRLAEPQGWQEALL